MAESLGHSLCASVGFVLLRFKGNICVDSTYVILKNTGAKNIHKEECEKMKTKGSNLPDEHEIKQKRYTYDANKSILWEH